MTDIDSSDELHKILAGDLTVGLAQVTPLGGVVVAPVNNFGWDAATRTITFTSDLAAFKKLYRLEHNPKVAVAFHTREHGSGSGDDYILLQGDASFSWDPNRTELATLLDQPRMVLSPTNLGGPFWSWWLGPFFWDRVTIRVRAERIIAFTDRRCLSTPSVAGQDIPKQAPASQRPPAKRTAPRINVTRTTKQIRRLPHTLLGWRGADGYPVVVPVEIGTGTDAGITLTAPDGLVPPGGRRAGLTGHWFSAGTLGQRQITMTGWLETNGNHLIYAPHTKLRYVLPPSKLLFRVLLGAITRAGILRARRAGVPSLPPFPSVANLRQHWGFRSSDASPS
ncbi:pyridoxamine 5'-phosphate oxidase family protein [Nocardia vinacea]|uniref:pyridoxamine 5'-phosphate oxidase family protein n=1 Tax=Nocardia vinacea TaxID=96468 RepID=UPI0034110702